MSDNAPKVEFGQDYHTAQIYSRGFEFAFMSRPKGGRIYKQATTFVYCKDFLHDAVWAFLNKTKVCIFGFKYDFEKDEPLKMDRTALALRNLHYKGKEEDFHAQRVACVEFLQGVDQLLKFRPTQVYEVPNEESPCWLILGDKRWQLAPTLVSLYTLLVRIGFFHKSGDTVIQTLDRAEKGEIEIGSNSDYAGNRDCSYVKQSRKGINAILEHGMKIFHPTPEENYPLTLKGNGLHDNYGIVNFTKGRPKQVMPHWYREGIWE